jgi:hypothetical protein
MNRFTWTRPKENSNGQDRLANRKAHKCRLAVENLEGRALLSAVGSPPAWRATSADVGDVKNGPLAKAGQTLIAIYMQYANYVKEHAGSDAGFTSSFSTLVSIRGNRVGVDVRGFGNFSTFVTSLSSAGMQITATDAATGTVDGFLPIANLLAVATMTQTVGLGPLYSPVHHRPIPFRVAL